jgi:hypothetical protein
MTKIITDTIFVHLCNNVTWIVAEIKLIQRKFHIAYNSDKNPKEFYGWEKILEIYTSFKL